MSETARHSGRDPQGRTGRWRPVAVIALVIIVVFLARTLGAGERLDLLRDWIVSLGPWGPVVFVLLYGAAAVAAIPGSALSLTAGALFGPLIGVLVVSAGSIFGAATAFLVARYVARDTVARWLSGNERLRRLDALTETHGAAIVALTRLVPLFPYNLLNYGFGLTRVRFWTYLGWSAICMLPAIVLYVVGAAAVFDAIAGGGVPWPLVAVLAAVTAGIALLGRYARRRLRGEEAHEDGTAPSGDGGPP